MNDAHEAMRTSFAAALLDRDQNACPRGLDGLAARRFAIHRNNVHHALGEALGAAYPAVRRLVGERFFSASAREFFAQRPQRNPSLTLCGEGFADFLASFPPAAGLCYLVDVARLERAWLEACHAADAPVLDPASLEQQGAALADLRLAAHPATRLVQSTHPIVSLWRHNRAHAPTMAVTLDARAEHALITRPEFEVRIAALQPASSAFTQALLHGDTASNAYTAAVELDAGFDVTACFAQLITAGAFTHAHEARA